MLLRTTRRTFIKGLALTGLVSCTTPLRVAEGPGKLRHACIGVWGMGRADLKSISSHPAVEIVALCDVDAVNLAASAKEHPKARTYKDWRIMLRELGGEIDSVSVSTPDHTHASAIMTALRMGKHVYSQKPLCHDIFECRAVALEAARRPELVTQMGIQIQSFEVYRKAVRMIQQGLIGKIKEVHSWCGKGWVGEKGKSERRPDRVDPVPEHLDWDLWLGTAPERPYVEKIYHPSNWRRWIDFGTGTQGDMACHIMDPVFGALELTSPLWVQSECSPPFEETYSPSNRVVHLFPRTPYTADDTIRYTWYDSQQWPDTTDWPLPKDEKLPQSGSMFVGEKGFMLLPHFDEPRLLPAADFEKTKAAFDKDNLFPPVDHYLQYVDACLRRGKTTAAFSFSGPLTETVLMGCIANRFPKEKLVWDTKAVQFTNKPEANAFLRRTYREGWEVDGLSG